MTQTRANTYANDLIDRLASAATDDEIVAICEETESAVKKLQTVAPARFHHVVNLVQLRRKDFARAKAKQNRKQEELW